MTEQEWLAATDPGPMLGFLRASGRASERKLRLFACACCRSIWHCMGEALRGAIEVGERYADGTADWERLAAARPGSPSRRKAETADEEVAVNARAAVRLTLVGRADATRAFLKAAHHAALTAAWAAERDRGYTPGWAEAFLKDVTTARSGQVRLLRDLLDPFHPPASLDAFRTPCVLAAGEAAYADRLLPSGHLDPALLAALAAALQDAGCQDAGLLGHLRAEGPHVRGCFVVDALLGKE